VSENGVGHLALSTETCANSETYAAATDMAGAARYGSDRPV